MKRRLLTALLLACTAGPAAFAGDLPSVFIQELTWTEVRDALADGYTTIIIPTGGTEQNGPHMVLGKHNVIVEHAAGEIARRLGSALVAPVMAYVPEGPVDPPAGHMQFPGTITLPEDVFMQVVEYAARSFKVHGFRDIVLIGDSGGNLNGLYQVSLRLNDEWIESDTRVHFIAEFTRGEAFRNWLLSRGETPEQIGHHAGIMDTSVAMAVDPALVRNDRLAPGSDFRATGVLGDPSRATVEYGRKGLEIQIENTVGRIRELSGGR
jgi:creatinine amidohydrolase